MILVVGATGTVGSEVVRQLVTAGQRPRAFVRDARDIAAVAVAALSGRGHEGKVYTLTGPQALSFDEVARICSQQSGRQFRHVRVSPDAVREALQARGVAAWFAADMARLHGMLAAGYEEVVSDDVHSVTGSPPRTLARFAADFTGALTGQPPRS
jgi:uncharacterized protein YbjT (DUF2867 family)